MTCVKNAPCYEVERGEVMKKTWYLIIGVVLLVIGCIAYGYYEHHKPKTAQELKTVRVAYLPITHALPVFATKELETAGGPVHVELVKYGSWPELMDALNTGKVDAASVLVELGVKAREQGIDIRAAALGHTEGNIIIVNKDINSVQDLKGKSFAIPHKQSTQKILVDCMLEEAGLSEKDVQIVEMSPPEMPSALSVGQIAGYSVAEPFGSLAIEMGTGKVFEDPDHLWHDNICCALVFNGQFVDEHHDLAKAFTKAYLDAGKYLDEHPKAQEEISLKYMKFNDPVIERSLKVIGFKDLALTEDRYNALVHHMTHIDLIKKVPTYSEFVDQSLLP